MSWLKGVLTVFFCFLALSACVPPKPMEEQSNQTFDQILNETLEPSVVKEERKETGVNESPAEKSVDDKKEQNKPEENYRLNLEKMKPLPSKHARKQPCLFKNVRE